MRWGLESWGQRGAGRGMRNEMEVARYEVWAVVPRCVWAGGSEAGQGGSGRCFYQRGSEMDREATARDASSLVSAETTVSPSWLPPGQLKHCWMKHPYSGAGDSMCALLPQPPQQPTINSGKAFFRLDLETGAPPPSILPFLTPHLKPRVPPCTGCSRAASTQATALQLPIASTPRAQMPLTAGTGTDKGVSTLCRSQTSFPSREHGTRLQLGLTSCIGGRWGGKSSPS